LTAFASFHISFTISILADIFFAIDDSFSIFVALFSALRLPILADDDYAADITSPRIFSPLLRFDDFLR
jgi:hypothetical protein